MRTNITWLKPCFFVVPLFGFAAAATPRSDAPDTVTAIRAGSLVDAQAGRVQRNQIILIRGSKIEALGGALTIPADVIAVDGDPIADIQVLENVSFVMKEGRIYKHE